MVPSYFDYIFVHLRQKARHRSELCPEIFVNFRPEPSPKSPARLTTLVHVSYLMLLQGLVDIRGLLGSLSIHLIE